MKVMTIVIKNDINNNQGMAILFNVREEQSRCLRCLPKPQKNNVNIKENTVMLHENPVKVHFVKKRAS